MVRIWRLCIFWFGMLLVPAVGYLMLDLGVADPIMVTFLGIAVLIGYFGLKVALSSQRKKQVDFVNRYFDAVLHSTTHEELRDNLEVLLRKVEESGWKDADLDRVIHTKETSVKDRYQNLRKVLELTVTAVDYKESRRADPETLKKLKLDLPNLEIRLRSVDWGKGESNVAQRLFDVRYQYWFSFAAALRLWSGVALPMILITWCVQGTSVFEAGRNPEEVYTLKTYGIMLLISFIISRLFGWR